MKCESAVTRAKVSIIGWSIVIQADTPISRPMRDASSSQLVRRTGPSIAAPWGAGVADCARGRAGRPLQRNSTVVALELVTYSQDDDTAPLGLDFVECEVACASERDDELAPQGTAARPSKAERRAGEMAFGRVLYRVYRALS